MLNCAKYIKELCTYAAFIIFNQFQMIFNGFQINNRKRCLNVVHIKAT